MVIYLHRAKHIYICYYKENQKIQEVEKIELLSGKGVIEDRHFQESNDARTQITLIESENIDYFNKKFNVQIPYVDFRRNIITQGIELNKFMHSYNIISGSSNF